MAEAKNKNMTPHTLEGKVVMVTGASSGIGWEICLDLAKAKCRIVAAARRVERLRSLCDGINVKEGVIKAVAVELDVAAGERAIEAAVEEAWKSFGRIDVLVNNAGFRGDSLSLLDMSEEQWDKTFATNLNSTWLLSKFICNRKRVLNQKGSIINISSNIGLSDRGYIPEAVAYSTSKVGINTLTKVMAMDVGKFGIRVNSISPGIFESEMTGNLMRTQGINNVAKRTIPLKTFGTTNPAITSLVRYLINDSSEYVNGNLFIVDAGASVPGIPFFSSL